MLVIFALRCCGIGIAPPDVPPSVPRDFDCEIRKLAYVYAQNLAAGPRDFDVHTVYDALQLNSKCSSSFARPRVHASRAPAAAARVIGTSSGSVTLFVDPSNGVDATGRGSEAKPLRTLPFAVNTVRRALHQHTGPRHTNAIMLLPGTHWLNETLQLDARDENLTIASAATASSDSSGEAILSGGMPLGELSWTKQHHTEGGGVVFMAELPRNTTPVFTGLRLNSARLTRARHPNADIETTGLHTDPTGWNPISSVAQWLPGVVASGPPTPPISVMVRTPCRNDTPVYPYFTNAIGGVCDVVGFEPNISFWCNPRNPRDGARGVWNATGGIVFNTTMSFPPSLFLPAAWLNQNHGVFGGLQATETKRKQKQKQKRTEIVHVWHSGGHWATMGFELDNATNTTLRWSRGGFQDARASNTGAEWYIENALGLLDAPSEWFVLDDPVKSPKSLQLFFVPNGTTDAVPPSIGFVATRLETVIAINGTSRSAVARGITIANVTIRDSKATFMKPHGVPSSGDWALARVGALLIENAENVTVSGVTFTRLDGNGVLLSGYTRDVVLAHNEFAWIGGSAMAAWGSTDQRSANGTKGWDASAGNFPRRTLVTQNVVREIGLYEKQAAAWFSAKTSQTTLRENIFFNGPRAGINLNDGFGGGHIIEGNLLFSFCRESSDHGPINTWDRQMFSVRLPDDSSPATVYPLTTSIHRNFLIANYHSQEAVDNDDGSAYFETSENVIVYGSYGMKLDMAGHDNRHHSNLYLYLDPLCFVDLGGGEAYPSHRDTFANNVCVQAGNSESYAGIACTRDNRSWPIFGGNTVYNAAGKTSFCGTPLAEWQAKTGRDLGTRVIKGLPPAAALVVMARQRLHMQEADHVRP